MREHLIGWAVGTLVYVVALVGGGAVAGAAAMSGGDLPPTWPLLVVPGALAAVAAVYATRTAGRPSPTSGLVAVAVPALVSVWMGVAANGAAAQRADVAVGVQLANVLVPVVVMVAVGVGTGLLRRARWSETTPTTSYETVS